MTQRKSEGTMLRETAAVHRAQADHPGILPAIRVAKLRMADRYEQEADRLDASIKRMHAAGVGLPV